MSVTDEELLLASRSDGDRFGELFDRQFAMIYRYLHRRVGSDLADELGAETAARERGEVISNQFGRSNQ